MNTTLLNNPTKMGTKIFRRYVLGHFFRCVIVDWLNNGITITGQKSSSRSITTNSSFIQTTPYTQFLSALYWSWLGIWPAKSATQTTTKNSLLRYVV